MSVSLPSNPTVLPKEIVRARLTATFGPFSHYLKQLLRKFRCLGYKELSTPKQAKEAFNPAAFISRW